MFKKTFFSSFSAISGPCNHGPHRSADDAGVAVTDQEVWGVVKDTWILGSQKFAKYPKKVSKSIQEYPKVSIFVSFFVDQSHPLNQLSTSSLEF